MHNRHASETLTAELCANLPLYHKGETEIAYAGIESKLPYTMACIKENFRISAVFTMPLPRLVTDPKGVDISGCHVPQGVSWSLILLTTIDHIINRLPSVFPSLQTSVSMLNHVLHHDPRFWGEDHDQFIPERWLEKEISSNEIMPFGAGHRACIGRNIANINILKVISTLWRNFEFSPVDKEEILEMESVGVGEKKGPLLCTVSPREN